MANLITVEEFAAFRDISKKRDEAKINEAIAQAQKSDLIAILGDFYFDVVKNAGEASYSLLMDGGEFTYCEEEFQHDGIKAMLADYAHARYVYNKPINDTAFGMVIKNSQDSTPVDRNILRDLQKQDQIDAGNKFIFIEKYIMSEPELFSRYCKNKKTNTSFSGIRISKL